MPRSANWEHDGATSRLASASAPNGVNPILTYFALPHDRVLQSLTHTGPGNAAISSYGYDYDAVGNITNWTQNQVSNTVLPVAEWKLSMDNSDQLTGVTVTGQPSLVEVFGYDNGGNRLTRQKGSGVSSTTFNDLNQIETIAGGGKVRVSGTTSEPANVLVQGTAARMLSATNFVANPDVNVGTNVIPVIATDGSGNSRTNNYQVVVPETPARSFTYDLNGNLTSDGLRTYESDGLNRLVKITQGTDAYEFAYDGFNRRVTEKKNGTLTKRFVWDGLTLAEERDADNHVTKRFFPQGEVRGTTKYFYTRDHLGSIREVTDASGAIVAAYSYDAWGKRTLLAGTDLATSGYTGHYTEHYANPESDLIFAPYRAYDPETGRWLSRDPIGENGGINLYEYVSNNPVDNSDLLGLCGGGHGNPGRGDPNGNEHDDAVNAEKRNFPKSPQNPGNIDPYGGAYRHCVAACLLRRHYGPGVGELLVKVWDGLNEDPKCENSRSDMKGEQDGLKTSKGNDSCEKGCLKIYPAPAPFILPP